MSGVTTARAASGSEIASKADSTARVDFSKSVPTKKETVTTVWPGKVELWISSSPSMLASALSMGSVTRASTSAPSRPGTSALTTTTGNVMSGNSENLS